VFAPADPGPDAPTLYRLDHYDRSSALRKGNPASQPAQIVLSWARVGRWEWLPCMGILQYAGRGEVA